MRNFCSIIREFPNKRQYICQLIYAHCAHDLQLRIKVVQSLKKHLQHDEIVYSCHAFLIQEEEVFNEQWFDVFLYYALIGLQNPKVNIRVYSLNVLNSIARHNAESILDITDKIYKLSFEKHWEIKAQCLEFAITIMDSYRNMSHLLVPTGKGDDMKKPAAGGGPSTGGPPGGGAPGDKNSVKTNLNLAVDMVNNCFNLNAPKSVQKIGLFKLQNLLPDFKVLYQTYLDVLVQTDDEIKQILLSEQSIKTGEEIFYSFGNGSFNYKLKSDIENFDPLLMSNAMIDLIISHGYDSLMKEHMQIFAFCCNKNPEKTLNSTANADNWFKVFSKFKDFLLVSICDDDLVADALEILHNFLTSPALKFLVYEDSKDSLMKSIELLYDGNTDFCKEQFKDYLDTQVVTRTEDTDNALKKFFKGILQKFSEEHSETYLCSNITHVLEKL